MPLPFVVGTLNITQEDSSILKNLLRVCAGLVVVVRETPSSTIFQTASQAKQGSEAFVRLIHFSAEEYFQRTRLRWFPHGHANIASTCVTYLSFNEFKGGAREEDSEVEELLVRYPLLEYAAQYWGEHTKHVETNIWEGDFEYVMEPLVPFLQQPKLLEQAEQIRQMTSNKIRSGNKTTGGGVSHALAMFRLSKTCQRFLTLQHYEDRRDSRNQTALHIASVKGADWLLGMLVNTGKTDVDARDADRGWSPLLYAVSHRNKACVELLLGPGKADVNASSSTRQTALFIVAETGDRSIADILLRHPRIDINRKDEDGNTALIVAFQNGKLDIVEMLLGSCALTSYDEIWAQKQMRKLPVGLDRAATSYFSRWRMCSRVRHQRGHGGTAEAHSGLFWAAPGVPRNEHGSGQASNRSVDPFVMVCVSAASMFQITCFVLFGMICWSAAFIS